MKLRQLIEKEYELKITKWHDDDLLETDAGKKRIYHWNDQQQLEWHIKWRESCRPTIDVMINRMIRTKSGATHISFEEGWVSLHDEVTTLYPMEGHEAKWALLIGEMLASGKQWAEEFRESDAPIMTSIEQITSKVDEIVQLDEVARLVLKRSCVEAKNRMAAAERLKKAEDDQPLPLMDPFVSLTQAKQIYNVMLWQATTKRPERGYRSIRLFLEQWLYENGEESLENLITVLHRHIDLTGQQGELILSECLQPWELDDCLKKLEETRTSAEGLAQFEVFQQRWETSRKLVLLLSRWIDNERKKVAT
ncbi:hypothetical protein [Desertibacillus haloalkaliphilus]|uniref:hypothetical protein n=1 Tax=Desertibacillus haloalkaliphilus TaxID=1328930 RepID=UPI001C25CA6C|nr:hypothetical protein [Desertibacillus haloalkaliphilus]MBU8905063.1 hypothetical protein [Desertibacillus haloalkaliphilus]